MATLQEQIAPAASLTANGGAPARRELLRWLAILLCIWSLSGIYEGTHLKRGWVPWDAGAYSQSADRVLHGQLPHRDFIDVYTGGLSYLNAAAMRIFGETLAAERLIFFAFFIAWIPALYWVASQFCGDWLAGALVLLAVAWSVPNYSEAVPSWYNLFFATFGIATLLAYVKRANWKWLLLAGACGGISFLAKSVGLCYVAAVLLFFLFREQSNSGGAAEVSSPDSPVRGYTIFLCAALAIFLVFLIYLESPLASAGASVFLEELILFVFPSAALSYVLLTNEARSRPARASITRFMDLSRMCIPFCIGMILPIVVFLVPYIRAHAVRMLLRDLFAQASTRIAAAHKFPDAIVTILPAMFLVAAVIASAYLRRAARWILFACVMGLFVWGLVVSFFDYQGYVAIWSAAYWLPPILVIVGSGILLLRLRLAHADDPLLESYRRQQLFLLLSLMALCSLVQFPYSAPVYFCYIAPLVILVIAALVRPFSRVSRPLLAGLYVGFLAFVVFVVTPGFIYVMGFSHRPDVQTATMDIPRADSMRVDPASATTYDKLIPLIRAHAGSGEIYCAPDCPEVYFLSGYANPTPDIYDFLDPRADQDQQVLHVLADSRIRVVILNDYSLLSPPLSDHLHQEIAKRFLGNMSVGNFEVLWRVE
jgi:hypothetical protein